MTGKSYGVNHKGAPFSVHLVTRPERAVIMGLEYSTILQETRHDGTTGELP